MDQIKYNRLCAKLAAIAARKGQGPRVTIKAGTTFNEVRVNSLVIRRRKSNV
jgi:hypothetical protein